MSIDKEINAWRKGQTLFNFLEFAKKQGLAGGQNYRLADTFYISDKDMDKLIKDFEELYLIKK